MRKVLATILAATIALSMISCSNASTPSQDTGSDGEQTASTVNLILGSGGVGGTYYPLGGALAQVWNDNLEGVSVPSQSTGASVENTVLIENGEIELGLTQNDLAEYAVKGEYMFDKQYEKMKVIGRLYSEDIQVFVREDSGINSISDMAGKRISKRA